MNYIDGLIVLPKNKGRALDEIKKIGVVTGFTAWDYLDLSKSGKIKIFAVNSLDALIKQGKKERIDGLYINPVVARYRLNEMSEKGDSLVFDSSLPHTRSSYHLATIKHENVIKELNEFLKEKKSLIEKLEKKYKVGLDF